MSDFEREKIEAVVRAFGREPGNRAHEALLDALGAPVWWWMPNGTESSSALAVASAWIAHLRAKDAAPQPLPRTNQAQAFTQGEVMTVKRAYYLVTGASRQALMDHHEASEAWRKAARSLGEVYTGLHEAFIQDSWGVPHLYYLSGDTDLPIPAGLRVDKKAGQGGQGKGHNGALRYLLTPALKTKLGRQISDQISAHNAAVPKFPCLALGLKSLCNGVFVNGGHTVAWPAWGLCGDECVLTVPLKDNGTKFDVPLESREIHEWEFLFLFEHHRLPTAADVGPFSACLTEPRELRDQGGEP